MPRRWESVDQAVAEAMAGAGVLSSGYRHEARAVDPRGHQFVVFIDLPKELASITAGSLAQIGATITKKAKGKNAGDVMGVYWRVEHDAQARNLDTLNLLVTAPPRNVPLTPVVPVVPTAPSATETPSQRIAKLHEMMKDDVPLARNAGSASPARPGQHSKAGSRPQAEVEDEDEPGNGFADTVIGFDVDDKRARKR